MPAGCCIGATLGCRIRPVRGGVTGWSGAESSCNRRMSKIASSLDAKVSANDLFPGRLLPLSTDSEAIDHQSDWSGFAGSRRADGMIAQGGFNCPIAEWDKGEVLDEPQEVKPDHTEQGVIQDKPGGNLALDDAGNSCVTPLCCAEVNFFGGDRLAQEPAAPVFRRPLVAGDPTRVRVCTQDTGAEAPGESSNTGSARRPLRRKADGESELLEYPASTISSGASSLSENSKASPGRSVASRWVCAVNMSVLSENTDLSVDSTSRKPSLMLVRATTS